MARHPPRYQEDYDGYYSDDSNFVDSRHVPRSRPGSRNDYGYSRRYPPRSRSQSPAAYESFEDRRQRQRPPNPNDQQQKHESTQDTLIKVSLVVGLLQLATGIFQLWSSRKSEKRDKEERRWRRREFEKTKRERRRNEEILAQQREMHMARDRDRQVPPARARITGPPSRTHSSAARERVRRGRLIEPSPSDFDNVNDRP